MPDYTIGIAERIASLPDSFATSNSVNRNYFQATNQSVINKVTVALAPDAPTALNPNPDTDFASSTDGDSVNTYGQQDGPLFITLLATIEEAGELSEYLLRADPAFWFSNLAVSLNTLSEANKNIIANLEIGQQIAVTKTFPAGVVPQTVTEYLFVEGISHRVTPETHVVTIYTGPATTYLQWTLSNYLTTTTRTNFVTNPNFEVNTTGWEAGAGAAIARITTDAYIGTACVQVTLTNPGNGTGLLNFVTPANRLPVSANTTYTISAYVKQTSGTVIGLDIDTFYFNAAGGQITSSDGPNTALTSSWQRITRTITTPALTASMGFGIGVQQTYSGSFVYVVDAIMLEQTSTALPYFDGTYADAYTGYTLVSQQWNGTANASTSTGVWGLTSSQTGSPLNDSTYGLD